VQTPLKEIKMNILNQFRLSVSTLLAVLIAVTAFATPTSFAANNKKVLMVISGYGQEEGAKTPGFEFDEFAKAYWVFKDNGIKVDIASPQGGEVVADKYDANKPYNARILADSEAMTSLSHSLSTKALDPKNYDGIFIVGGKGAMFDLPKDEALKKVIASVYQQQGIVAAVCHGPAALVDVKLDDGSYLVANKSVNAFTNQEEKLFGKQWLEQFEFMLQDKLIERGANYESSGMMLSHVAQDERLITGQNPASTVAVATALVKSLGFTPSVQQAYSDDNTLAVIARLLDGDNGVAVELENKPEEYQLPLVGMYGFYYQKIAATEQQFEHALTLMMLAQKDINNPMLDMQIAKTQHQLGKTIAAKATLKQLLTAKPDFKPALDMLQTAF
jgi:putative intracellular protease/amidase